MKNVSRALLGDGYCHIRDSTYPDSEVHNFSAFFVKKPHLRQ